MVPRKKSGDTALEDAFLVKWNKVTRDRPTPLVRENAQLTTVIPYKTVSNCNFELDFYHKPTRVVIEINGATHQGRTGGHSSYYGINRDYFKSLMLQLAGWRCFYLDSKMAKDETLLRFIAKWIWHLEDFGSRLDSQLIPVAQEFPSFGRNAKKNNQTTSCERAFLSWHTHFVLPDLAEWSEDSNNLTGLALGKESEIYNKIVPYKKGKTQFTRVTLRKFLASIGCTRTKPGVWMHTKLSAQYVNSRL